MHIRHLIGSLSLVGTVLLLTAAGLPAQQAGEEQAAEDGPPPDARFVYIDSQELLQKAPGATQAQKTWSQELQQYRAEVQQLKSELDSLQQSYQQQEGMLSDAAKERKQQEIMEKQQQLQQRVQELEEKAGQRQQELLSPILSRVQSVIQDIREEQGYVMVFDASSAGVLAADPRLDITDLVVRRLERRNGAGEEGSGSDPGQGGS